MIQAFLNIFRVPELRKKILFTLFMLMIYRIGYHVTLPGVDQAGIAAAAQNQDDTSAAGRLANYVSLFAGGNLQNATIFSLGIMPYISSSIIFQLLGTVVPSLEKLQKEGDTGRRKIQEWSRYVTVPLCFVQAIFLLTSMQSGQGNSALVLPLFRRQMAVSFWLVGLIGMTAGSIFLMWLGEQIDEYGLGNGVSFVILAGIVARMPNAVGLLVSETSLQGTGTKQITPGKILFLVLCFVFVIAGSILITQAQRRIPIQQAKHTRGRRIYGGQKQYLPLRVNHGGVMPIIFAQSLMLFPGVAIGWLANRTSASTVFGSILGWFNVQFSIGRGGFIYLATESAMIYFFAYFWTTVQFQPKEMANQLRDYGSFIPGLRPGKRTSDYLEKVMTRITYVGAGFLCVVAIVPTIITTNLDIPYQISAFLGGTGLLIVVSVALDMVQRIEANLLMRNYGGFLGGPGTKGKRIKGRQY
ncbi:MAG: preprotein translocase subunit SecY [Tepidisphaeraceae bacterium]|jgi:preprotein translocase subunit SecY